MWHESSTHLENPQEVVRSALVLRWSEDILIYTHNTIIYWCIHMRHDSFTYLNPPRSSSFRTISPCCSFSRCSATRWMGRSSEYISMNTPTEHILLYISAHTHALRHVVWVGRQKIYWCKHTQKIYYRHTQKIWWCTHAHLHIHTHAHTCTFICTIQSPSAVQQYHFPMQSIFKVLCDTWHG